MWNNPIDSKKMRRYEKGESSRKTDTSDENERPFKKAKYVWQLKGKYHLKEQYKCANPNGNSPRNSAIENDPVQEKKSHTENNNNKNCTRCLSTLIAHSNTFLENEDLSDHEDIPVSLVSARPRRENHDEFLQKWQARQVAKSFIDNTINTILEQWKLAPADATEFVENCDNGQVEDEGIMMAIQSHGLQSSASRFPYRTQSGIAISSNSYVQESSENYRNKKFECSDGENGELEVERPSSGNETDQMDFLSTAVTMAIQNKGLSSYSYG